MAHFAEIDKNNLVIKVLVTDNNDPNGDEGLTWLNENLGGIWIKTSYNGNIRRRFAGIGYTYNEDLDMFIMPKCHEQAALNENGDWDCDNEEHNG